APIDIEGLVQPVFGAVNDKAELLLHWPAGKYPQVPRNSRNVLPGPLQQARDRALADRSVDDDPERSLAVVSHHQDDGVGKSPIVGAAIRSCPVSEALWGGSAATGPSSIAAAKIVAAGSERKIVVGREGMPPLV